MSGDVIAVPGLAELPFVVAIRDDPSLYGLVKTAHLLGVALLIGPVIAFDLRVLGLNRRLAVADFGRHLLPLAVAALVLIVPSGLAMFAVHSADLVASGAFALKMALLLAGGILAVAFHAGPYRSVASWNRDVRPPGLARLIAAVSMTGWIVMLYLAAALRD